MFNVGILGHSLLVPYLPGGSHSSHRSNYGNYTINFYCSPNATFKTILESSVISNLISSSPHLIILVLGCNDLGQNVSVKSVHDSLIYLVEYLKAICSPRFGVHILEPELRLCSSSMVNHKEYRALRNSLVRKIKVKRQVNFLPLTKFGFGTNENFLSSDGVHFNSRGYTRLLTVINHHIFTIIQTY